VLTLLLTRHGHTTRSEPEQYLGQAIVAPLTERGRADAQRLAGRLRDVPIDRIVSSPLQRAADTAAILAGGRLNIETDDRLKELDYGTWEGHTVEEIERRFPGDYQRYDADPSSFEVGGGENGGEVAARLRPLIAELLDWAAQPAAAERTAVLVGHSSVNRVLLAVLMETPLPDYRRRWQQDWANLTVLHWPSRADGPKLLLYNDVSHLRGSAGVTW
jgi:broad specificity phosphatase PhoE